MLRRCFKCSGAIASLLIGISGLSSAQTIFHEREDPEKFRIEVMGSGWILNSGGQIQANGTPADFINDLKIFQRQPTFFGQLVVKPGCRHRLVLEGTPFSIV